jgi:hypothetical protein
MHLPRKKWEVWKIQALNIEISCENTSPKEKFTNGKFSYWKKFSHGNIKWSVSNCLCIDQIEHNRLQEKKRTILQESMLLQ